MRGMRQGHNFERFYVKFAVKSPLVFYTYLLLLISVFLIVSSAMRLEKRQIYAARIHGNEIEAVCSAKTELSDGRIYVYRDKNQEVFMYHVKEAEYGDGIMRFILVEEQNDLSGDVILEIVEGNHSLFQRIFTKTGTIL